MCPSKFVKVLSFTSQFETEFFIGLPGLLVVLMDSQTEFLEPVKLGESDGFFKEALEVTLTAMFRLDID